MHAHVGRGERMKGREQKSLDKLCAKLIISAVI